MWRINDCADMKAMRRACSRIAKKTYGLECKKSGRNNYGHETVVNFVVPGPCIVGPCLVEVLNPSRRITGRSSAFCRGFESDATKTLLASSAPLYALIAIIGVLVFLLFVLLIYRAAPSPSTKRRILINIVG
jgi:hypothetical protein